MLESRVPSSRIERIWQYGGLATSMTVGAIGEGLRRVTGKNSSTSSLMLTESNIERLVSRFSRLRGAALKIGQMISFQGIFDDQRTRNYVYLRRLQIPNLYRRHCAKF